MGKLYCKLRHTSEAFARSAFAIFPILVASEHKRLCVRWHCALLASQVSKFADFLFLLPSYNNIIESGRHRLSASGFCRQTNRDTESIQEEDGDDKTLQGSIVARLWLDSNQASSSSNTCAGHKIKLAEKKFRSLWHSFGTQQETCSSVVEKLAISPPDGVSSTNLNCVCKTQRGKVHEIQVSVFCFCIFANKCTRHKHS